MRIRAVVVNYNGGDEVLACLRALLASSWPTGDLEVVVVDNGSVDDSPERIEVELPAVRVVRSPGNLGYPAINQVVTDLTGIDAVAIVNPDAVVDPGCLAELARALADDPGIGAACPRILLAGRYREVRFSLDGSPRASVDLLEVDAGSWHLTGPRVRRRWHGGVAWSLGDGSILRTTSDSVSLRVQAHRPGLLTLRSGDHEASVVVNRRRVRVDLPVAGEPFAVVQNAGSVIGPHGIGINRGYHHSDGPLFDQPVDVPAWCGAAVLLRSDYLRQVGLLDPRWFLYYEDTDLAWRGLRQGWRYRYVPRARVTHAHSTTIGHGSGLYDVQHVRNRVLTVAKNAPRTELAATWWEAFGLIGKQLRSDVVARVRDRRLPELVLTARRVTALARAARLLPAVLRDARRLRRTATVADDALPVLGRWRDPTGAF